MKCNMKLSEFFILAFFFAGMVLMYFSWTWAMFAWTIPAGWGAGGVIGDIVIRRDIEKEKNNKEINDLKDLNDQK